MNDIESRAREYITEHSEYSEVFGETFVAVDTLTAMVDFAEQETKELETRCNELFLQTCGQAEKIAELEKENVELKKMHHESDEDNNRLRENIPLFTEAKELLQKCLNTYLRDPELRNEVERFLKELEK